MKNPHQHSLDHSANLLLLFSSSSCNFIHAVCPLIHPPPQLLLCVWGSGVYNRGELLLWRGRCWYTTVGTVGIQLWALVVMHPTLGDYYHVWGNLDNAAVANCYFHKERQSQRYIVGNRTNRTGVVFKQRLFS